jgi:hypothetical protein
LLGANHQAEKPALPADAAAIMAMAVRSHHALCAEHTCAPHMHVTQHYHVPYTTYHRSTPCACRWFFRCKRDKCKFWTWADKLPGYPNYQQRPSLGTPGGAATLGSPAGQGQGTAGPSQVPASPAAAAAAGGHSLVHTVLHHTPLQYIQTRSCEATLCLLPGNISTPLHCRPRYWAPHHTWHRPAGHQPRLPNPPVP